MTLSYEESKELLVSGSKFRISLGLERIKSVLNIIGNPQNGFKSIHVAGTNGKGSVCSILANILEKSGFKTGLYTSPHLVEYTERIKINGKDILQEDFSHYIEKICIVSKEHQIDLTEFEILTAAAFKYFKDNNVDFALIETGLGGRYDATNVFDNPLVDIITSISLDHTDILGNTVEQIAFEKAGIIKENSVVVISKENSGYETVKKVAEEKNAKCFTAGDNIEIIEKNGKNYLIKDDLKYEFSLFGDFQKQNTALVFETVRYLKSIGIEISEKGLIQGLKTVYHPGRMQYLKNKNILIDGAHNPSAAVELRKYLDKKFPAQNRIFIYGSLNTKDYKKISEILFKEDDEIFYFEFSHKNAVSFEEYRHNLPDIKNIKKFSFEEFPEILNKDALKIITGSFYMTGEIYSLVCDI